MCYLVVYSQDVCSFFRTVSMLIPRAALLPPADVSKGVF